MLDRAAARLAGHPQMQLCAQSAWHESRPVGGPQPQPRFLNGAAAVEMEAAPVARYATRRGIPFLPVRAVLDPMELSLADLRAHFPQTAPNRYSIGKTPDPLTLVLEGGSTVTKGRDATLVVEDAGRIGKFRIELRSGL